MKYIIIRSTRKTLAIQINSQGEVIVRSPKWVSNHQIDTFVQSKKTWIIKHQKHIQNRKPIQKLSKEEIIQEKEKLKSYIIPRIHALWEGKNLPNIASIKITTSEKRWGSCSSKNGLCFSYRLRPYIGTQFLDAIIYHELAHLREKHHQKKFWDLVYSWMPDYDVHMKTTLHSVE